MSWKLSKRNISRLLSLLNPHTITRTYDWLGFWGILKYIEIKLLGRHASTYCFGLPNTIYLMITNECQLQCKYCYRMHEDLVNPHQGVMTFDNFITIAKQIKGVRQLNLYWGGEPLLHKDFIKMLAFISANKIARRFGINSNGMLLTPDIADKILATNIDFIWISLDGSDAETQESIRVGSTFDTIVANARYLAQHAPVRTKIEVWSVLTIDNFKSIENMPEFLHDLGIKYFHLQRMVVRTSEAKDMRPSEPCELVALLRKKCKKLGINFRYYPRKSKTTCISSFIEAGITWDGMVTPCVNIYTLALNSEPYQIKGVLNGPEMRKWRRRILNRDYSTICTTNCDIVGKERTLTL